MDSGFLTVGTISTGVYALLMLWGYASQIRQLHRTKSTKGLSAQFFLFLLMAVTLRLLTVGSVIRETSNLTAKFLAASEIIVFLGLLIISLQVWWYRR